MKITRIIFPEREECKVEAIEIDTESLGPSEIIYRTHYSIISAGTELSGYTGKTATPDAVPHYPVIAGNSLVGEVLKAGGESEFSPGDMIHTFGAHSSAGRVDVLRSLVVPLKRDDNLKHVVFARMAFVGMTAVQLCSAHPTQTALVVGLGVVGNLASQLFQLSGCHVLGLDLLEGRLERARECGIENVVNSGVKEPLESVQSIPLTRIFGKFGYEGRGLSIPRGKADIVVEAIGKPSIITQVMDLCRPGGQVILLGSPRGMANIDATKVLQRVHIASYNVTLRGAHEWIYPVHAADDPNGFTMERGARFILNWIRNGKLKVEPLITDVYNPYDAKKAYDGLLHSSNEHLGVLFDWSKVD